MCWVRLRSRGLMSESPLSPLRTTKPLSSTRHARLLNTLQEALTVGDHHPVPSLQMHLNQNAPAICDASGAASVVGRLLPSPAAGSAQVSRQAFEVLEGLHESYTPFGAVEGKGNFCEEAVLAVLSMLQQEYQDELVLSSAMRVLLKWCGCMCCANVPDRSMQDSLREMGAVETLVSLISRLRDGLCQGSSDITEQTAADAVLLLFCLCHKNEESLAIVLANKGLQTLRACVQDDSCQKTVQEHGCIILAELACCGSISNEDSVECIATITKVGRSQLQGKCREAACATVCALTMVGSYALHFGNQINCNPTSLGIVPAWKTKEDMVEHTVVEMMHSCCQKDDPLLHQCLQYMFVVGKRSDYYAGRQSVLSSAIPFLYHHVLLAVQDIRTQGAALRALCSLLQTPQFAALDILAHGGLGRVLCIMRDYCSLQEAPDKDVLNLEIFGLGVLMRLLNCIEDSSYQARALPSRAALVNQLSPHLLDIHLAVLCIAKHLSEASKTDKLNMYLINNEEQLLQSVGCSYQSLRWISSLHQPCRVEDMIRAIETSAVCLMLCGEGAINVADNDGVTILHGLAQLGRLDCLAAFVSAGGHQIDFLKTTKLGLNAMQLARANQNVECLTVLEKCVGASMRRGDVLPLSQPQIEDCSWKQYHESPDRNVTKNKSILDSNGVNHGNELNKVAHTGFCMDDTDRNGFRELGYTRAAKENWTPISRQSQCMLLENQTNNHRQDNTVTAQGVREGQETATNPASKVEDGALCAEPEMHEATDAPRCNFGQESHLLCSELYGNECCGQYSWGANYEWIHGQGDGTSQDAKTPQNGITPYLMGPPTSNSITPSANKGSTQTRHNAVNCLMHEGASKTGGGKLLEANKQHGQQEIELEFRDAQCCGFGTQQEQGINCSAPCHAARTKEEDHLDDHHMMRWLSSEISGLIDNAHEDAGDLHPFLFPCSHPQLELERAFPKRFTDQTRQSSGYEPREWSKEGYATMDTPCSPLNLGSVSANSSSIQYSPARPQYPTPNQTTQAWIPQAVPQYEDSCPSLHSSPYLNWDCASVANAPCQVDEGKGPSKHLWLGNLNTRLPRSVLKSVFEQFGPVEDVVTFPGRMYAFVNYVNCEDAQKAAQELDAKEVPALAGSRKLVVKFRPNRKALGRVGDLMPGVNGPDHQNASRPAPSIPSWHGSCGLENSPPGLLHVNQLPSLRSKSLHTQGVGWPAPPQKVCDISPETCGPENQELGAQQSQPSKHLWIGNVCLRPSKTILFNLFSWHGAVESVRIFPGKTFAFVNFQQAEHAARAKECLDGEIVSAVTGAKALVVRFQRDGSGPPSWFKANDKKGFIGSDSPGQSSTSEKVLASHNRWQELPLVDSSRFLGVGSKSKGPSLHNEDIPGLNLANRLNPNNIHYDCQLALRYKKMGKGDKEALWAMQQDRCHSMDESSLIDPDGRPVHRTATEADSIGHHTRTLSAAARGKPCADRLPMRSISLGSTRTKILFDEGQVLDKESGGFEVSSGSLQAKAGKIPGHRGAVGLSNFPFQNSQEESYGNSNTNMGVNILRAGALTSRTSLPPFQSSITSALRQFEKIDPFATGQANRPQTQFGSSSGLLGKSASLLHQTSRDTFFHTCLSLGCDEAASENRRI